MKYFIFFITKKKDKLKIKEVKQNKKKIIRLIVKSKLANIINRSNPKKNIDE
jgi:hypothetical protein|tara:strand:- start:39 stop:194 length:156 start_codon:yes stop_codon:yes gene_type:complete